MQAKLHINLSQGILDVEGDKDFVLEIYSDFKGRLSSGISSQLDTNPPSVENSASSTPKKSTSKKKKTSKTSAEVEGMSADKPSLDKTLDTSNLQTFVDQYQTLSNHAERVLVFLSFLVDELDIELPNTDQVYTCYMYLKEKIPTAFAQAFRDANSNKYGYIDYNSATDISITTKGRNHLNFGLAERVSE